MHSVERKKWSSNIFAPGCTWSEWSEWSSCSITCGDTAGTQTRARSQQGSHLCQKKETESKPCHKNKCSQDCTWAKWSEWSACSQTCGTGKKTRIREIDTKADFGGRNCLPKDGQEAESCLGLPCPVDGLWSEWSKWSYCNATCGVGYRKRLRFCDNPKPENGGANCEGQSLEVEQCKALRQCPPVNGGWAMWSKWSSCSQSCDEGKVIRTRTCTDPAPQNGGFGCHGDSIQQRPCYFKKCNQDSDDQVHDHEESSSKDNSSREVPKDELLSTEDLKVASACSEAPYVFGFLGPFSKDQQTETHEFKLGEYAVYMCYHGKVIDLFTNRRHFSVPCVDGPELAYPQKWPECIEPKYCIGPAPILANSVIL